MLNEVSLCWAKEPNTTKPFWHRNHLCVHKVHKVIKFTLSIIADCFTQQQRQEVQRKCHFEANFSCLRNENMPDCNRLICCLECKINKVSHHFVANWPFEMFNFEIWNPILSD